MTELKINLDVFLLNNVEKAEFDYKDLADISIQIKGKYAILNFDNCKYDESLTIKEFENYLIGLENS